MSLEQKFDYYRKAVCPVCGGSGLSGCEGCCTGAGEDVPPGHHMRGCAFGEDDREVPVCEACGGTGGRTTLFKTTTYACGCVTHWKVERMDPTPLTCPVHEAIWERTDSEDDKSVPNQVKGRP